MKKSIWLVALIACSIIVSGCGDLLDAIEGKDAEERPVQHISAGDDVIVNDDGTVQTQDIPSTVVVTNEPSI